MKEFKWDDSTDSSKAYFDATVRLPVDEADDAPVKTVLPKTHFTDLRRRIEERLDGKRIDHEFEYDNLGGPLDKLN
jgi:hypothetical protein